MGELALFIQAIMVIMKGLGAMAFVNMSWGDPLLWIPAMIAGVEFGIIILIYVLVFLFDFLLWIGIFIIDFIEEIRR